MKEKEITIQDIIAKRKEHSRKVDTKLIMKAYNLADGKHKNQCAENCYNTRKKLGKAHQQTVRELIYISNNSADDISVLVRVDI